MKRLALLKLDPELASGLTDGERLHAERVLLVPEVKLATGRWHPPAAPPRGTKLGLLVLDGQLIREINVSGGRSVELLGNGDLIRPWQEDVSSFCSAAWRVLQPTRLAALDDAFAKALGQWPAVTVALVERSIRRSRSMALEAAVSNLIGVDRRVLTLLWQLAEKWGRIEAGTVVVRIRLTHELMAELIGARRPSVTEAFGRLVAAGEIEQRSDGFWALKRDPPTTDSG